MHIFYPRHSLCLKRFRKGMWQSLFEKQSIMCFQFINYKIFKSTVNTKELVTARYLELLSLPFPYLLAFSSPPHHHEEQNANKMQMKPLRPERIRRKTSVPKKRKNMKVSLNVYQTSCLFRGFLVVVVFLID